MQSIDERIHQYAPFFGDWELKDPPELLGRGNSGTVFRIWDRGSGGVLDAAMKAIPIPRDDRQLEAWLKESGGSQDGLRRRIQQELEYVKAEIQTMETLKSDSHIVCFERYEIHQRRDVQLGWDVLIRMERLVPLAEFLNNIDRYPHKRDITLVLTMWDELLSGLCLCERNHVLHLDIKPDNIFYAEPSKDYFKLGDFGVSIRNEKDKIAGKGTRVGTEEYMAPEMYHFKGSDSRSDIYSLGVVIYELLNSGRLPFMSPTDKNTPQERSRASVKRLSGKTPIPPLKGVNARLMDILLKCLAYNPDDRFANMQQMQAALRAYMYGKVDDNPKPKSGSSKLPLFIGLGVVSALGIMVLVLRTGPKPEPEPRPIEVTEVPVAEPPFTEAPEPEPPTVPPTEPPVTEPPVTEPPVTEPPVPETLEFEIAQDLALTEDQPNLVLRSNKPVTASIFYIPAGQPVESAPEYKAEEVVVDGEEVLDMQPYGLNEGDTVIIAYEDEGNPVQMTATVSPSQRQKINVSIDGLQEVPGQELPVLCGDVLSAEIQTEADANIAVTWRRADDDESFSEETWVDEQGLKTVQCDSANFSIDDNGAVMTLQVGYLDGLGASKTAELTFLWTTKTVLTALEVEPVMDGDKRIAIITEPGARTWVSVDGAERGEPVYADANGFCEWIEDERLTPDSQVVVSAADRFGNEDSKDVTVGSYALRVDNLTSGEVWDSVLRVSGIARPGSTLKVLFSDDENLPESIAIDGLVANDSDGSFSFEIEANMVSFLGSDATGCIVTVGNDTDGYFGTEESFEWHRRTRLGLESAPSEDSTALVVFSEPTAKVTIVRQSDGVTVFEQEGNPEGRYSYAPEGGFVVGTTYVVTTDDPTHPGRENQQEVTVTEAVRDAIEADIADSMDYGLDHLVVKGDRLIVYGLAMPGMRVEAVWQAGDAQIRGEQTVNEDGTFELALENDGSIGDVGVLGTVAVRYADGRAMGAAIELNSVIWTTDTEASLAVNPLMDYSDGITVLSEPSAVISIREGGEDGREVASGTADERGLFTWKATAPMSEGDVYYVTATDIYDNTSARSVSVMTFNLWVEGVTDDTIRGGEATIEGVGEPNSTVALRIVVNGESIVLSDSVPTDGSGAFSWQATAWDGLDGQAVSFIAVNHDGQEQSTAVYTWNVSVPLEAEQISEDSGALVVHTEAGARVVVTQTLDAVGNAVSLPVYDDVAGEDGNCAIPPTGKFFPGGTVYHIEASAPSDSTRPVGTADVIATEAVRAGIDLTLENATAVEGLGQWVVRGDTMKLRLKGEPGETVSVAWVGGVNTRESVTLPKDGVAEITLSAGGRIGRDGRTGNIRAFYESGKAISRQALLEGVVWTEDDRIDRLEIGDLMEGDTSFLIQTEPGAMVAVYDSQDARVNPKDDYAGVDGSYVCIFDEPAQAGQHYTVTVRDRFDNEASATGEVAVDPFAAIKLSVEPEAYINAQNSNIAVQGGAESGAKVLLNVNGTEYPLAVDDKGSFRWSGLLTDMPQIPMEGEVTASVTYAEGHVNRASKEVKLSVDRVVPVLENVNLDSLSSRSTEVTGTTEMGAEVTLSINGSEQTRSCGPDGFAFTGVSLSENDNLSLWATDAAGNVSEILQTTIGMQQAARVKAEISSDGNTLHVTGWAVGDNPTQLALYIDGISRASAGVQVREGDVLEERLASEIAAYEQEKGIIVNVKNKACMFIDIDLKIDDLSKGTHTLELLVDGFAIEQEVLASSTFEKTQDVARVPNEPAIDGGKHFAFGLDNGDPMNSKGILLTGWYCGPASNEAYTISEVRVLKPEAETDTKFADEIINSVSSLPVLSSLDNGLSQGYIKLTRQDVAATCPSEVMRALEGDTWTQNNAGFIVWIDSWNLEDGDYKVVVVTLCGGNKYYSGTQLTIDNGKAMISSSVPGSIAERWNPPPVEETKAPDGAQ